MNIASGRGGRRGVNEGKGGVTNLRNDFRGFSGVDSLELRDGVDGIDGTDGIVLKVFERARRFGVDFACRSREREGKLRRLGRGGATGGGSWKGGGLGNSVS